jgi:hypothetical protein
MPASGEIGVVLSEGQAKPGAYQLIVEYNKYMNQKMQFCELEEYAKHQPQMTVLKWNP